ncbi:MAG: hypothetical protein SGPRY_000550 [Prymnesium sp.]
MKSAIPPPAIKSAHQGMALSRLASRCSSLLPRLRLSADVRCGLASGARSLAGSAQAVEEQYARPLQWVHWLTAFGTVVTIGTVKSAQATTGPTSLGTKGETKAKLMLWHKSTAVLVSSLFFPRVLLRLFTKLPAAMEGHFLEQTAAKLGHASLYAFMLAMPASGIAMGYYGGKGVPFYGIYTFPGKANKTKEDGQFAGKMFGFHKNWGYFYPYFLAGHVAGFGYHVAKGQTIFARINPLARLPK